MLDVKIEAPAKVLVEKDGSLAPEVLLIEEAIHDCLKTLDCVVRTVGWVPNTTTSLTGMTFL